MIMQFQKHHLTGMQYIWSEKTGVDFRGEEAPTRRLFDRFNGDQVLFIINYYSMLAGGISLEKARLIEEKIQVLLPMEARSEISVFNWINGQLQEKITT